MFVPTIKVDNKLCTKLHNGDVYLRSGQWIKLDWCDRPARYIGRTPSGVLVVQHYEGGYCQNKFRTLVRYWRGHFETTKTKKPLDNPSQPIRL